MTDTSPEQFVEARQSFDAFYFLLTKCKLSRLRQHLSGTRQTENPLRFTLRKKVTNMKTSSLLLAFLVVIAISCAHKKTTEIFTTASHAIGGYDAVSYFTERKPVKGNKEFFWYKRKVVYYFNFGEKNLTTTSNGLVPTSPIYVSFNINPDQPNGGPASGFKTEPGTDQTHNVIATLAPDAGYSPLWTVIAYNNNNFSNVSNLTTAASSNILVANAGNVNCPLVKIQ